MITLPQRVPEHGEPVLRHATAPLTASASALLSRSGAPAVLAALTRLLLHRYGTGWEVVGLAEDGHTVVRHETGADQETTPLGALAGAVRPRPAPLPGDGEPYVAVLSARAEVGRPVWTVVADGGGLTLLHDTTVLDAGSADRVARHLALLADELAVGQDRAAGDVDLLLPEERELLLETWNAPHTPHADVTLHQLFREQSARTPDAVALRHGDTDLTYGELDGASDRFAHALLPHVGAPGDLVVLTGERDLDLFTAILGIWKAGGGFVYLDPALPAPRAADLLALSEPVAVLTTASGHTAVGDDALKVDALLALDQPAGPPPDTARPDTTAYVLFTSGSSGTPKGVVRPHRMHTSRIRLEQGLYRLGPEDRHLLKSPISFREFVWPLAGGGTAVLAEPGRDRDDRYLAELIHDERITTVSFVPSMLRLLLTQPAFRTAPALRHVFVGGEALGEDLEGELRSLGFEVHNTYTLSEADYVCHRTAAPAAAGEDGPGTNVGVPLDMRIYLCDPVGRLVPPGIPGEIHTGGPGLSDGYLGRPDLTEERFLPNRHDSAPPLLFRTGDVARYLPGGEVRYLGRADDQVKVRGQRVEPAEVEIVLRGHPGVANAAVVSAPDPDQGAALVAYVVPEGEEVPVQRLREYLAERLPDFMVPARMASVPALPLLGSGKVDRKALRVSSRTRPEIDVPYAEPATEGQRRAAELVARVLGLDQVGVDDDFFALGGDSLRLMLLRGALEAASGRQFALADVFAAGTPRGCARLLDEDEPARTPARRPSERRPSRRRR
ncbi:non-ribosomal peptide synthetase [Lentzea sp. HUAS12]|uniref:non-ribosomal peptide synthetase n=1 Tax=Lentzea sp. HUAS12 TaxID=2951806 RepID=UPI00209DF82D|nr:non-ribosomal peptide synthetase [Lentzea sp. HUAS12]USX53385.1 non-ribosomal peptide synthetase [Lentzea sp. HUAS12]